LRNAKKSGLTKINDSVARIGIVEGDYHWHKHEDDDEFFFVLSGQLFIDLEDKTIELNLNQVTTISKGIMHRMKNNCLFRKISKKSHKDTK